MSTIDQLMQAKRNWSKRQGFPLPPNHTLLTGYRQLIDDGKIEKNAKLMELLRVRKVRTLSGVAVITVLTKPYGCPGRCVYCPTEYRMPKSYVASEPAAQRALRNNFDPFTQVQSRIEALTRNGHPTDKIELIVLGGTWSAYPQDYQEWFIRRCYDGANGQESRSLEEAQKINETTDNRVIGLTLETRPDWITPDEIALLRRYGVTRMQLGVQSTHDDILRLIKRGHTIQQVAEATKLLKDAGFKINYHLMPGLPGSSRQRDLESIQTVFNDERFKPDYFKLYPTVVMKNSELYHWWKKGTYQPYTEDDLLELIPEMKKLVPYWVRIERLIRDIPGTEITAGNKMTNLRQVLKKRGVVCKCIRCREARDQSVTENDVTLFVEEYQASEGVEYFISYENAERSALYAFVRLRLPKNVSPKILNRFPALKNAAHVRELHTYGQLVPILESSNSPVNPSSIHPQHTGFGKRLMREAEKIAKKRQYRTLAVISGIGVREYYKKLGYEERDTYMVKGL